MKKSLNRLPILLILFFSSLLSVGLFFIRMKLTHEITFSFLIWNLFLAAIPLLISTLLIWFQEKLPRIVILSVLSIWLLFFPNSPYILTDLFHLYYRPNIPLWFDLIMILSFAWNGLMMGFISLMDIQQMLSEKFNRIFAWFFTVLAIFLASFGVYLGRFLRWNSWDILTQPFALFRDVGHRFLHPFEYPRTTGVTFFLFIFLFLAYLTVKQLAPQPPKGE